MIKFCTENLLESKSNFIVCLMNNQGLYDNELLQSVSDKYPHIEIECAKYIHYNIKKQKNIISDVQYTPTECWALVLIDTIKNNNVIAFDNDYQYIVNLFCQKQVGRKYELDLIAFRKGLTDIKNRARQISATVSISCFGCKNITEQNILIEIIDDVFGDSSDIEVKVYKYFS